MYFDMRSELTEASKALEAIDKQTKPGIMATYKAYTSEQLGEDLGYFVVERIRTMLTQYETRKKEDGETVKMLESMGIMKELRSVQNQLDLYVNEDEDGNLLPEWPQTYIIVKKKIDHIADMLEQIMETDVEGGCVFGCCGGYWTKTKEIPNVQLKVNAEQGLGKAATKAAAAKQAAKDKLIDDLVRSSNSANLEN